MINKLRDFLKNRKNKKTTTSQNNKKTNFNNNNNNGDYCSGNDLSNIFSISSINSDGCDDGGSDCGGGDGGD